MESGLLQFHQLQCKWKLSAVTTVCVGLWMVVYRVKLQVLNRVFRIEIDNL